MNTKMFFMAAPPAVYRNRRARLAAALDRPMVIFAGHARARNYATNTYPFRAGSSYLYFGGPPLEGAAWLIEPESDGEAGCTLLREVEHFETTVWIGTPPADEEITAAAGISRASLAPPEKLESLLVGRAAAAVLPPCPVTMANVSRLGLQEAKIHERQVMVDMRLIKDEHEIAAMRRAADVGVRAHLAAMAACQPGKREADIAAELTKVFVEGQCVPSFTPIVTVHGEVLHTDRYVNVLEDGQLLLVDAGTEEPGGYASDMTRTYPVHGGFTPIQRHLYDTVLNAQRRAIEACVPGRRFRDIHDLAARVLCEGLVEAELLHGDPADLAARAAHTLFFTHGLGHLIGLDVHDMEDFGDLAGYPAGRHRRPEFGHKFLRLDRDLEPGMAVTIEPGLYLVPAIWHNSELISPFSDVVHQAMVDRMLAENFGGIRIEETVVVQPAGSPGPEIVTRALANDAEAVTALVGKG